MQRFKLKLTVVSTMLAALLGGCGAGDSYLLRGQAWETDLLAAPARAASPVEDVELERAAISLAQAVEIAVRNNPELAARRHDAIAAESAAGVALSAMFPLVKLQASATSWTDAQRLVPASENGQLGVFSSEIASADVLLSMPVYTGGRLRNEFAAAEMLELAARHRTSQTESELVYGVSRVFLTALGQQRVIESLEASERALSEHVRRVQALLDEGKAARVDILRTDVRLAEVRANLTRERNALATQKRALAALLGLDSSGLPGIFGELALETREEEASSAPHAVRLTEAAFATRPDYLAAKATVEAQAKRAAAARAARLPTVSLQAAYGQRWALGEGETADIGRAGVLLDIPVFEGGRLGSRAREETVKLAAAEERLRALALRVRQEIENAVGDIESARERAEATAKAIEQSEESLRIERERYELGRGSITDVLDAQAAMLASQTEHYRAIAAHNVALARLRLATGETR